MRLRTHLWIVWLAGLALAGCVSHPGRKAAASRAAVAAAARQNAPVEDYSAEAVEKRTEAHSRYISAQLHAFNDDTAGAAEEYYQAALADPASEELVQEAVRALLQAKPKQPERALEVLTKATAQPGASGELFARLAMVYSLAGQKEQAIEASRKAIQKAPKSLQGYQHLAQIHFQSGNTDAGLEALDQAGREPDVDAPFLVELAELYTAFGRALPPEKIKPRALEALNRAAKLSLHNPLFLTKMAEGFASLGEADKAVEMYEKMLEMFPAFPGLREKLADIYLRKQDRKRAMELLKSIVRDDPINPRAYFVLGDLALQDAKPKEAVEYLNKALLLKPDMEEAYFEEAYAGLARAQIELNESRNALATLERARDKVKQSFLLEFVAGLAYGRLKEYTNAIERYTAAEVIARVTATNRLTHYFYFQFGAACERAGQFPEAEKHFRKCLTLAPDYSMALNYLGYMWADRGVNLTEAREMIEKAVHLEPKNGAYLDSLGWVLFKLGEATQALEYLLKAIEHSDEPDATLYDHLGDIYASLNQPDKAREAWQKALTIEPNDSRAEIQKKLSAATGTPPR
jgi:tetratricopeptide (TPR) repeat protein